MNKLYLVLLISFCFVVASCSKKEPEQAPAPEPQQEVVQPTPSEETLSEPEPVETEPAKEQPKQTTTQKSDPGTGTPVKRVKTEEETNPRKFVRANNVTFASRGVFSNDMDVNYTLNNTAKISYKNVVFKIESLDKEHKVIGTEERRFDENFTPGFSKSVNDRIKKVKGVETVRLRFSSATPIVR